MKVVYKTIVICCALTGIALSTALLLDYYNNKRMARKYVDNCHKIKSGMSLTLARSVLGEFDDNFFFIYKKQPEFYFLSTDSLPVRCFLEYPYIEDEGNVTLEFDPYTKNIVSARCGEGPY